MTHTKPPRMPYSEKLKDPRWQKRRLEILQRDDFKCTLCGDSDIELHVHHKKYAGEPWDAPDDCLTTYCKECHLAVETASNEYGEENEKSVKRVSTGGFTVVLLKQPTRVVLVSVNQPPEVMVAIGKEAAKLLNNLLNG